MRRHSYLISLLTAVLVLLPRSGDAQDSWLDAAGGGWNFPGMAVPAAPGPVAADSPFCQDRVRPVETAEDAAVAARGWRLFSAYERGWGITLVGGFVDFDAMCRPVPYQRFVFVDGVFAGTLAPRPMVPRSDGALTDAGISVADQVYAVYDRYGPSDPLCCPSGETTVTFAVERTPTGPVVTPGLVTDPAPPATPLGAGTPLGAATLPVCVGLGGDALSLVHWTAEEIAAHEARFGPIVHAHPETGACQDPAGLPLLPNAALTFSWVCSRTSDGLWYGPVWTAEIYLSADAAPPDPATGGCPLPRDPAIPPPPDAELAAATAVYLSQLEAAGALATLYAWLHPDARAVAPESAVVGWYTAEWLPRGPNPITITSVDVGEWTWAVTGTTYPRAAEIAYEQSFADGSVVADAMRLVQDEHGAWRWFFGRDRAFVEEQIERFP
jgi:hypothetical protein